MANISRYIRQELLSEIGSDGQNNLSKARVAIIGAGGLGSIVAPYLGSAGIGYLRIIDSDTPSISNLHRQVFYKEGETKSKSTALASHILSNNSDIEVVAVEKMISKDNISTLIKDIDIVVECTDQMHTKYLVNDYCHIHHIPMVYGAIYKYDGYVTLFENKGSACVHLRDIFPEPDHTVPSCAEVGVLNTTAGLIGILQANEVLKYVTKIGVNLIGKMLTYDVLHNQQMTIQIPKVYAENLVETYHRSEYNYKEICETQEIDYHTFMQRKDKYHLISILEHGEHVSMDEETAHHPMSQFDPLLALSDKMPNILYCMTGKRSAMLVGQIKDSYPDYICYSLKGGLSAIKNNMING